MSLITVSLPSTIAFLAAAIAVALGVGGLLRKPRNAAQWSFLAGMLLLGIESLFAGMSLHAIDPQDIRAWLQYRILASSLLPGAWILFSITYSRGRSVDLLSNRWPVLMLIFVAPFVLAVGCFDELLPAMGRADDGTYIFALGWSAKVIQLCLLASAVIILMNLERTFRASVGMMRWRIKFMIIGLGLLFAARIYTSSQHLLYSTVNQTFILVNVFALLLASALMARALWRTGVFEVDVYPSRAVIQNSLTVVLAGIYLLLVGVMARVVTALGGDAAFPLKAFMIMVSLALLATIVASDRLRQRIRQFVSRHFQRPHFDYRKVWTTFTERTTSLVDKRQFCRAVATWLSETFQVLSTTIWIVDDATAEFICGGSTALPEEQANKLLKFDLRAAEIIENLRKQPYPVQIDQAKEKWAEALKQCNPEHFPKISHQRICAPLMARNELLGFVILGDRVAGLNFSVEDLDLLKCVADQIAANLLNIRLSQRLLEVREMEAFQNMSAFFVHDLKNTASTLSLMLKNMPAHFDDPGFREDSLRGLDKSVSRINELIGRLSLLRQELQLKKAPADLNKIVALTLSDLNGAASKIQLTQALSDLPQVSVDAEQIRKVISNLIVNASDASPQNGEVKIETARRNGWVTLTVSDHGCGMTPEFLQRSLFRPFQTTKKSGIGIGMFLSKMIVEAHQGKIEVESTPGQGTTFRILLPLS